MVQRFPKIDVGQLQLGMFVTDLDRPWLDTPFLIEGLLLDQPEDLGVLRRLCQYVYIDPSRSALDIHVVDSHAERAVTRTATNHAASVVVERDSQSPRDAGHFVSGVARVIERGSVSGVRPHGSSSVMPDDFDGVPTRTTEPRSASRQWKLGIEHGDLAATARALISDTHGRARVSPESTRKLVDALRHGSASSTSARGKKIATVHPALIPPTVKVLVDHPVARPVGQELPRARAALARTDDALDRIVQDIQAGSVLELEPVHQAANDLVDSVIANPDAMMWVARLRGEDAKTYAHGLRVAVYMLALGRHLGFPRAELRDLGTIGLLIDVGKLRIPRTLLERRGKLTAAEFDEVKRHVDYGLEMLNGTDGVTPAVLQGIAEHHERMNGQGYPFGLRDQQISVYGRIAGLADCFAALISPRPYAQAMAPSDSLVRLFEWSGEYFHPALVERFVQAIGVFPVGSLVELSTGHVGIVIRHNRLRRLQPKILLLTDSQKRPRKEPMEIDLMKSKTREDDRIVRIVRGLPAGAYGLDTNAFIAGATQAQMAG